MNLKNPVRIFHCADIHLGKSWNDYASNQKVQRALVDARMESLRKIVEESNRRQSHFLVIAGDLFDKVSVPTALVKETVGVLGKSEATVLVLPGNHDYYDGEGSTLWSAFRRHIADSDKFLFLSDSMPYRLDAEDQPVVFYPGICQSKHSPTHCIGWVVDMEKDKHALHIGIAHGNVEGKSLDAEDRYFTMEEAELRQSGVDAWLLGHIHTPWPAKVTTGHPYYFFSGTSAPDGFKCRHRGWGWALEFAGTDSVRMEQVCTGTAWFMELEAELNSLQDIKSLEAKLPDGLDNLMLRLTLKGRLNQDEMKAFRDLAARLSNECLSVDLRTEALLDRIDAGYIDTYYPNGSLAHRLLKDLYAQDEGGLALHLAHKLMEGSSAA